MPRGDGKKNHSVNRERSHETRARHRRNAHNRRVARDEWMKKKTQALRYWKNGDIDHP